MKNIPAIIASVLVLIYVAAYLMLVTPTDPFADYRWGGSYAEAVFAPAQWIDRRVLPHRWPYEDWKAYPPMQ